MKQISLLTIICCLLVGFARAATLSGTVTNAGTGAPVSGQKVYVIDSFNTYSDSTTTNSSGNYSFTLPGSFTNPTYLFIRVPVCGASNTKMAIYTGSNLTTNFAVCATTATYTIHGAVSLGTTTNSGLARVYLIRKEFDSTAMDTVLTAIDSFTTGSTGGTYSKTYSGIPYGTLLLKAALLSSHSSYSSYLPTYYTSSLNWSGASKLSALNFTPATATNINMVAGTNPGGAGFIGGSVLLGANKNAGVGDPLSGRILLLTNAAGQAVAYTYSDAGGKFGFSNLQAGTYKIFGDAWGKTNPALTVTISMTNPGVGNIVFEENNKTFKGRIVNLNAGNASPLTNVSVFPNPVTDRLQFTGLSAISGSKTVVLSDVTGAVISRQVIGQGASDVVPTATLPAGIYMLQLQTEAGNASFKIVK